MRLKQRIIEEIQLLGGTNIEVQEAHTLNDPTDPEGHIVPPTIYPLTVTASGVTEDQISTVILNVQEEESALRTQAQLAAGEELVAQILNNPDLLAKLKNALSTE